MNSSDIRLGALLDRIDVKAGVRGESLPLLSVSQYHGVIRYSELHDRLPRAESFETYKICMPGDIAFNKMSIRSGALGVVAEEGIVTYHYEVMRPRKDCDGRYLVYLMKSDAFIAELVRNERGIGMGGAQGVRTTEVPFTVLRNIRVPSISGRTQRAIADFLDRETAEIDAFIADQERLIELLTERRTATITHAVTKGLDSSAPMRDSGIPWLGQIPAHWELSKLKTFASIQTGVTLGKEFGDEAGEYPYLRVANVQAGYVDVREIKTVRVSIDVASGSLLQAGDVLMTEGGDRDKLGRGAIWAGEIENCLHQNHVFAVRPGSELDAQFLVFWLDSTYARSYFNVTAKKTTNLAATNSTTVKNLVVPFFPIVEQLDIVEVLSERLLEIDESIADAKRAIELSKERRAALISAAVTGQIDVRTHA